MEQIEKLTEDQWARVHEERERWRSIGTCTDPADRPTAERAITSFYRRLGHEAPRFVWLDGPLSCCMAGALLRGGQLGDQLWGQLYDQLGGQLWDQLRDQLGDQLGDQLWGQLGGQLRDQLGDQLGDQLWGQLRDQLGVQLRGQLRDQLGDQLYDQLRDQLRDQLGDQLGDQLRDQLYGQEWAFWTGHYAACRDAAGVRYPAELDARLRELERLVSSTGWWWPYRGYCLMAERPRRLRFDDRYLLHCEDGPAIECRDGYLVYAWHGTRVPAEWIEQRNNIDPRVALIWENTEQRRCAAEIIGWHRVLAQLQCKTIDTDRDPQVGRLVEVDLPDSGRERFLVVVCGTRRTFALPVPPEMTTALEANAWTYNIDPEQLLGLEVRT